MTPSRRRWIGWASAAAAVLLMGPPVPSHAQGTPVTVFAAASLKTALDEIAANWQAESGKSAVGSYAASSALAKQIEEGAPADIFVSADLAWMDYLAERKLIRDGTRRNLLGNRIVLVAPADSTATAKIEPGFDLAALLGDGRLAMADPAAVPAGKYGKAALEALGVWAAVESKVAAAENVRAALAFVTRGEAPAGIVYQTDAAADPSVKIIGAFPENTHPPIIYPIALTTDANNPDAAALLAYIKSAKAKLLFEAQGFTVLPPGQS